MNRKLLITSFGVVFTIAVLLVGSVAPAMAGGSGPGGLGEAPNPGCGGKPTISGTGGDDNFGFTDQSSEVYNMKGGNDTVDDLDAAGESDTVRMGDGNDTAILRGGNDTVCLGDGDDIAFTDDGWIDLIKCGDGNDTVTVDSFDILEDCENVTFNTPEF